MTTTTPDPAAVALERSREGVLLLDAAGAVRAANPAAAAFLGCAVADLVGLRRADLGESLAPSLRRGVLRLRRRDGGSARVLAVVRVVPGGDGLVQEAWLPDQIRHLPVPYAALDADGRVVAVSAELERLIGVSEAALLGRRFFGGVTLLSGDPTALLLRLGRGDEVEAALLLPGGPRPFGWRGVRDDTGLGAVGADRDELERLRVSEARFRELVERQGNGIGIVNAEERFTYVNPAAESIFGVPPGGLVGRSLLDFLASRDSHEVEAQTKRRKSGTVGTYELAIIRPNGERRLITVTATPHTDSAGRYCGAFGVFGDVTERRAAEGQMIVADRLSAIGRLSSGAAHQINNPLSYVVANIHLIREMLDSAPFSVDEIRQSLDEAQQGAERVAAIVRDLRAFSRAEVAELGVTEVRRALEEAISMSRSLITARAELRVEIGDLPVLGVAGWRLTQVVNNLLVNAAEAIRGPAADNHVTLRAGRGVSGELVVEVEDTGRGIPGDVLDRIFDPFFTTKATGGVGLGLTVCHGIVSAVGGRITVNNRPGEGCRFRVTLPGGEAGARPARAGPARLLIVDDEPHLLRTLRILLSHEHEVVEATNGGDALTLLATQTFDLILCDLYLDDRSGMDVHRTVASLRPEQAARMIFMTGGAYTADARAFLARIPNRWIEKPFSPDALRAMIDLVLAEYP